MRNCGDLNTYVSPMYLPTFVKVAWEASNAQITPALVRHLFLGRHEKFESGSNTLDRSVKSSGGQKGIYMLGRFKICALLLDRPSLCKLDWHTRPFSSDMGQNTRIWVLIHPVSSFPSQEPICDRSPLAHTIIYLPFQLHLRLQPPV